MLINFLTTIKNLFTSRIFYISLVFVTFSLVLAVRLYNLQIVVAETETVENEEYYTVKERYIPATRGMIYDKNGILLAYNELSYAVFLEDTATVTKNADKNKIIHELFGILKKYNVPHELEFAIEINDDGELVFNVEGNAELRFKKNAYGLRSVNNLSDKQRNATAEEVFDFLCNGDKSTSMFGVSEDYTLEEKLEIVMVRYYYFTMTDRTSQITVAINLDDNVIAALMEASGELTGVSIQQQTKRHYTEDYAVCLAHILGYTGKINENELNTFIENGNTSYTSTDYIGKTGIESAFEEILAGKKGVEQLTLSDSGRIIKSEVITEPVPGQNIYLTIDAELQKDYYNIVEKDLADILVSLIVNDMDYGTRGESSDEITIPIYEVYDALFSNNVLSIASIASPDGTDLEKETYQKYLDFKANTIAALREYVKVGNKKLSTSLSAINQDYLAYLYSQMKNLGYLPAANIDSSSTAYQNYNNDRISFYEYIIACVNSEWVDLKALGIEGSFYTSQEIYEILMEKTFESFENNIVFDSMVYRDLIFTYKLTGKQICLLLFDQNVLQYNEKDYKAISSGKTSAYTFLKQKIENLEITPAQLALTPCSGSVVQTKVDSGKVDVLVSYPAYDNNRLANRIDWDYYQQLLADKSNPLYFRATQQRTATGSTIKPLMAVAGFQFDVLGINEKIHDDIIFEKINPSPSCASKWGHGTIDVSKAIEVSCNYFFFEVAYRLATKGLTKYSDSLGISYIQKTATEFGFAENTGIEISEMPPDISDVDAVRTAIGYGNKFTATEISRYATTLANRGVVMQYTLIDKVTDRDGNEVYSSQPVVTREISPISNAEWNKIILGMRNMVLSYSVNKGHTEFEGREWCGKTGTAEVSKVEPPHALMISFCPKVDPEVSITVVLPNGNAGSSASGCAKDLYMRYYNIPEDVEETN